MHTEPIFIGRSQLLSLLGVSERLLAQFQKTDSTFPKAIKLNPHSTNSHSRWYREEVIAWAESKR